jgi:hypothetical protein
MMKTYTRETAGETLGDQAFVPVSFEAVGAIMLHAGAAADNTALAISFFPPADHPVQKLPAIVIMPREMIDTFLSTIHKARALTPEYLSKGGTT